MPHGEFHRQLADLGYNPSSIGIEPLPPEAVATHVEAFLSKHKPDIDVSDRIALKNLGAQLRAMGVDRNTPVLMTIRELEETLNARMATQERHSLHWAEPESVSAPDGMTEEQRLSHFLETGHAKELGLTGKQAIALAIDCRSHGLQILDLSFCRRVTDDDIRILTQNCPELRLLSLAGCPKITDRAIAYLAAAPQLAQLEYLGLEGCAGITDTGLQTIADSYTFSRIEMLNLHLCTRITLKGIRSLARSKFLKALKHLDISACFELGDEALAALSESSFRLETLDLSSCDRITKVGIGYLCDAPAVESLACLELHGCHAIADHALHFMAHSPFLKQLQKLDLGGGCRLLSETGIDQLALSANFNHLHSLFLGDCPGVTDHSLQILADSPHLAQLVELDVSSCAGVTDSGLQAIIKSRYLNQLKRLNISLTQATPLGLEMLRGSFPDVEVLGP